MEMTKLSSYNLRIESIGIYLSVKKKKTAIIIKTAGRYNNFYTFQSHSII